MVDLENTHKEEHKTYLEQGSYQSGYEQNMLGRSLSKNLYSP